MREQAFAWVCELPNCGHRWLASSDIPPVQCSSCRKRGWHVTKTVAELIREKSINAITEDDVRRIVREELESHRPVTSVTLPEPEVIRPSMDHLRDICAGMTDREPIAYKPRSAGITDLAVGTGDYCPMHGPPQEREPCYYKEYDEQTGETYACGLSSHSAKVKHTRGRKL